MAKAPTLIPESDKLPAIPPSGSPLASPSVDDFAEFAGAGLENVKASDLLVPRLTIIQALSPQLNRKKAEYIEEAKVGDIADVGMGELFPHGVMFIPVYYRKDWLEWAPRASGQGLVAIHSTDAITQSAMRNERKQLILPNGNLIAETAQFFGLNVSADFRMCFIPMASTQLKKAKRWLNLATGEKLRRADGSSFAAPLFYRAYNLTTADESNNEGEWSGWKIDRGPTLPELEQEGYDWRGCKDQCLRLREMIIAGEVKADTSTMSDDSDGPAVEGTTNSEPRM